MQEKNQLKKYFNNYCPIDVEEHNRSIVETLHAEDDHFIGIFGEAHLPSLHNKLHKETHDYLYISTLTKEIAKEKANEINEMLKILSDYAEPVVGRKCTEMISQYVNPYSFTDYWESKAVLSISY